MSDVFIACALHSALENLRAALGEYGEKQGRVIGQKRAYLRFEQDFKDQAFPTMRTSSISWTSS